MVESNIRKEGYPPGKQHLGKHVCLRELHAIHMCPGGPRDRAKESKQNKRRTQAVQLNCCLLNMIVVFIELPFIWVFTLQLTVVIGNTTLLRYAT